LLKDRRLAILFDPKKQAYKKTFDECLRLKDYLTDKNIEYWVGGTKSSHDEMSGLLEDLKENCFRPIVCFSSLPQHARSAKNADVLIRQYLVNASGMKGELVKSLAYFGRKWSDRLLSAGFYQQGFETRDVLYFILDGSATAGRFSGALTMADDATAINMFEKERRKHDYIHVYLEGGSGTKKSIDTWEFLIQYVHQILPEERTIHFGGGITEEKQIESIVDNISRKNLVFVVGNYFEREPERIEDFAALFPK
jgi:heptaprenylglyceryl phosphate synthase